MLNASLPTSRLVNILESFKVHATNVVPLVLMRTMTSAQECCPSVEAMVVAPLVQIILSAVPKTQHIRSALQAVPLLVHAANAF